VVILGNSGGGSLMAAYQSQALKPTLRPTPGISLPEALHDLEPADLYVSLNSHPGRPEVYTAWLDPSVTDEADPVRTDPELDMYNERNGPPYEGEFVERYRAAQRERNRRITAWALAELERLNEQGTSDRVFPIYRVWADLRFMDPEIDPSDRPPRTCYAGDPARANRSALGLGRTSTLRTWLSMWSLDHSQCRGRPHLEKLEVPALVVQSLGDVGVFPSDAREIHDAIASSDKTLELIRGAHYLETPDDARTHAADLIAGWLADHGA
jgi:pimeloyl-ACP methyl ester carboxylesterase